MDESTRGDGDASCVVIACELCALASLRELFPGKSSRQHAKSQELRKDKQLTENEYEHHLHPSVRDEWEDDRRGGDCGALRLCAGGFPRLPGYLARAATAAHAFDVSHERHLGHLARRFDRDCRRHWPASQQGRDDPWLYCRGLFDDKRRRWIRDYGSHDEDVQEEKKIFGLCIRNDLWSLYFGL